MRNPARRIELAILLLALALRLGFVLSLPDRPLYWDEPLYLSWAKQYQQAWSSLSGGAQDTSLRDAFASSLQKGEAYAATVGLVYAAGWKSPRAVFVLQAVLDTITCLLLAGLARAVAGNRAGLLALAFAASYEPFIFSAARLQTETLTSLLYVGGLWTICVPERRRTWAHAVGGLLVAGAMLARPAFQWLFPLLLPMVFVRNWDCPWRQRVTLAAIFAAGFFVVIGPRLVLTTAVLGHPVWAGTLDPAADMYSGAVVANAGWKTDRFGFANPPRDELLAVLGNGPPRRPTMDDFRAATIRTWIWHPLDSAAVTLNKLYVAWLYPYNDSRWTYLSGTTGPARWHQIILALGLIGVPLALRRWRVGIPLIATTLYTWLAYLVVKIEVRYAVTAMPMMICLAGVALADLSTGWPLAWQEGRRRRLLLCAAVAAAAVVAAQTLTIARLLEILPLAPDGAHAVRVAAIVAALGLLAALAVELLHHIWRRSSALVRLAPSLAVVAFIVLLGRPLAQDWQEWECPLTPDHGIARQEFILPAIQPPVAARLRIDLLPEGPAPYDLVVRVDGEEIKRYQGGLTRADADLPRADYFDQVFVAQRRAQEPDKAWYVIPVPLERISPGAHVAVEVALQNGGEPGGSVTLFGDYTREPSTYAGPSLLSPAANADTSLFKYLDTGDFRMRRTIPLAGSSHSRFFDGGTWSDTDLSVAPGRQQGRFRIFLLLSYERGIVIL